MTHKKENLKKCHVYEVLDVLSGRLEASSAACKSLSAAYQ
jgi:hypothetical protein